MYEAHRRYRTEFVAAHMNQARLALRKASERSRANALGIGLVRGAHVVCKGVLYAFVEEYLNFGVIAGASDSVDLIVTNVVIGSAEVDQDGADGFFGGELADAAGVVADAAARIASLNFSPRMAESQQMSPP